MTSSSPYLGSVQSLNLSGNHLWDRGARTLAAMTHSEALTELVLDDNKISDAGAIALAGSSLTGRLKKLSLQNNRINRPGARALEKLEGLQLSLEVNPLERIASVPPLSSFSGKPGLDSLQEMCPPPRVMADGTELA